MKTGSRFSALWIALLAGMGHAGAQTVTAQAAPPAWVEYAHRVSTRMQHAMQSDDARVERFRSYFQKKYLTPAGEPLGNLYVEVWLDREGHVSRVDFDPDGNAVEIGDLRRVLTSIDIGARPPRGMKQPVVVKLGLGEQI